MTRTDTGLTATPDERRRFRLLIRLAKAGLSGATPRGLVRSGGSAERAALTAELDRLVESDLVAPVVGGVQRYRLTPQAVTAVGLLFPEAVEAWGPGVPLGVPYVEVPPSSEFAWKPNPESGVEGFWTDPEPESPEPPPPPVEVHDGHAVGDNPIVDDGQPMTQAEIDHMRYQPPDSTPENFWSVSEDGSIGGFQPVPPWDGIMSVAEAREREGFWS